MRRATAVFVAVAAGVAGVLTGCATGSTAGSVSTEYFHDLGNGNYSDACGLLTDDLRRHLGDCPSVLGRRHSGLPRESLDQLRLANVSGVRVKGDTARVDNHNVLVTKTVTDRKGRSHTVKSRSIGVYQATDGKGLTLTKIGGVWRISGGGV